MTPETIIATLHGKGATVEARGGRLEIKAPRGVLTPELRSELVAAKPALLTLLAGPQPTRDGFAPLENRILEVLADGARLRPRELAERVGVGLDTGNPSRLLRLLPGAELFHALARLLDAGAIKTAIDGTFWTGEPEP